MKQLKAIVQREFSFFVAVPALIWQLVFVCVPLLLIAYLSFSTTVGPSLSLTLAHYYELLQPKYVRIIVRSLLLAFSNASLCLLCAYPVAYFLAFKVRSWKNTLFFLLILPFWTNLLVLVYSWFFILERFGLVNLLLLNIGVIQEPFVLLNNQFAITMGMLYCYLPFMVLPLYSVLEKLDSRLLEASADLGARPFETFIRVTVPQSLSGITTGFFLVFVPSFGEFVVPALLGGGKQLYVGSLLTHLFLVTREPLLGAAFTCLATMILLVSIVVLQMLITYIVRKKGFLYE